MKTQIKQIAKGNLSTNMVNFNDGDGNSINNNSKIKLVWGGIGFLIGILTSLLANILFDLIK